VKHVNHDRACVRVGRDNKLNHDIPLSEFPTRGCVDEHETIPLIRVLEGVREDEPRTIGTVVWRVYTEAECQSFVSYLASVPANYGLRAGREDQQSVSASRWFRPDSFGQGRSLGG